VVYTWPLWVEGVVACNHVLIALNASINLWAYCVADKKMLGLIQRKLTDLRVGVSCACRDANHLRDSQEEENGEHMELDALHAPPTDVTHTPLQPRSGTCAP